MSTFTKLMFPLIALRSISSSFSSDFCSLPSDLCSSSLFTNLSSLCLSFLSWFSLSSSSSDSSESSLVSLSHSWARIWGSVKRWSGSSLIHPLINFWASSVKSHGNVNSPLFYKLVKIIHIRCFEGYSTSDHSI